MLRRFLIEVLAEGPIGIDRFIDLRYKVLADQFPHGIFSVGQASLDFFEKALGHLDGQPFDKIDEPSSYEMNYRRWIGSHR